MIRSPHDGASRAWLRTVVGAVVAVDLVALAVTISRTPASRISHPGAFRWLVALGGRPLVVAPIAAAGLVALFQFVRRPRALLPGGLALAVVALLCECHAALVEGPMRIFFTGGAVLVGWLAGLAYARLLGREAAGDSDAEALAEMGAAGTLAATYVGAVLSKLIAAGPLWADADTLRAIVLTQRPLPRSSPLDLYASIVGNHPAVALTLAALVLVIQASAVLYPWTPRLRAVIGTALILFHLNVWMLTPILFPQAMILLAAFSYPWSRLAFVRRWSGAREAAATAPEAPAVPHATLVATVVVVALAGAAGLAAPVREYTGLHHRRSSLGDSGKASAPAPAPPSVLALLDGLRPGDELAGWTVSSIRGPSERTFGVTVARGKRSFEVQIARRGALPYHAPAQTDRYDLFYGPVAPPDAILEAHERDGVLAAVVARLEHTEAIVPVPERM